jgi:hypothetical protein
MSEPFNPFSEAYASHNLADQARSLSSTVLLAPAQESRRITALRHWLSQIAEALAEKCSQSPDTSQRKKYSILLFHVRGLASHINGANHIVPPGIEVVLKAFQEQLYPNSITLLNLHALGIGGRDGLCDITHLLSQCDIHIPQIQGTPEKVFIANCRLGEQDNILASPLNIMAFYLYIALDGIDTRSHNDTTGRWLPLSDAIAVRALGPAFLFSQYDQLEKPLKVEGLPLQVLEAEGWLDHPTMRPLLDLVPHSESEGQGTLDTPEWKAICERIPAYTPAQFDAEVPILWERLKQLLPPNELEIDGVESDKPASLVSILNAGWSFYLLHMEDLYKILGSKTAQDRYDAKMVLNRLLTKGVELSQITQTWRTARKAIGQ